MVEIFKVGGLDKLFEVCYNKCNESDTQRRRAMANGRDTLTRGDLIVADRVLFPRSTTSIGQYGQDAVAALDLGLIEWDFDRYIPTDAYIALSDALEGVK